MDSTTKDGWSISRASNGSNYPPGHEYASGLQCGISYWVELKRHGAVDWYRWHGRNTVLLQEMVRSASCFTRAELLELAGDDLGLWYEI